jgi:hypothetical protein
MTPLASAVVTGDAFETLLPAGLLAAAFERLIAVSTARRGADRSPAAEAERAQVFENQRCAAAGGRKARHFGPRAFCVGWVQRRTP